MPPPRCWERESRSRFRDWTVASRGDLREKLRVLAGMWFDRGSRMDKLAQDLRFAIRSLLRQPDFSLTAILTLALGIGATTAIFTVVNGVILRPLPFDEPHRIVAVQNYWVNDGTPQQNVSAPDFHDWKAQSTSFEAMAYYTGGEWSATVNGTAQYVMVFGIAPGFFEALHAQAAVGRLFSEQELRQGALSVVLTDAYWRRQFNADPSAIGKTLKFADELFTIIGVLEPGVRFPLTADFYATAALRPETPRSAHNYRVLARLRDGVTLGQAQAEMTAIAKRLEAQYPASNKDKLVLLQPLQDLVVRNIRQTLYVLLGAVGVVLLIACANVANLLLARSAIRVREMVVRAAVGASRGRLVRQLLTESAVLSIAAALLGAWLARLATAALLSSAPDSLPRATQVQVDLVALGFALAVALAASLIFGLAPALQMSRVQLNEGLRQGGKGSAAGSRTGVARSTFVVAEVALALVLVVGASLLGRSLSTLLAVDMGFDAERLLVLRTAVPVQSFDQASRATDFYREVLADIRTMPGVESAAGVTSLPTQVRSTGAYQVEGRGSFEDSLAILPQAVLNVVTPDYFRTLRVPLRRGRDFNEGDRRGATMVAIINESLARASFGDRDPVGQRIQCGLDTLDFLTIVGVVADVRTSGPASPATAELFMPYQQHPGPATSLNIVARSNTDNPLALIETIRRGIAARNSDVPVKALTMEETLETASETARFRTVLLVTFAGVALLLAIAGIYGVMSYTISQRIPELGIRIALGAAPSSILKLVIRQGATLAAIGVLLGLALALAAGRFLEGLLFGVEPRDPWIFVTVTLAVTLAALAACVLPGRRAVRVDPMVALRAE